MPPAVAPGSAARCTSPTSSATSWAPTASSARRTAAVALAKLGICRLEGRSDLEAFMAERTARIPLGRRSDPEEMAAMVVWLAAEAPDCMTAARRNVTGGLDRD